MHQAPSSPSAVQATGSAPAQSDSLPLTVPSNDLGDLPFDAQSMWNWITSQFASEREPRQRFLPRLKAGFLMLETHEQPGDWKSFYVALAGSCLADLALFYFADRQDPAPQGSIALHSAHVDVLEEVLMVITQDKTWFLCAETSREANDWAQFLCNTIDSMASESLRGGEFGSANEDPLALTEKPSTLKRLGSALALATTASNRSSSSSSGSLTGISSAPTSTSSRSSFGGGGGMAMPPPTRTRRLSSHVSYATVKEIQSRSPKARVDEFIEVFLRSSREEVEFQAMRSALSWSSIRSIVWRVWLGLIPEELTFGQWLRHLRQHRQRYDCERQRVQSVFEAIEPFGHVTTKQQGQQESTECTDRLHVFLESCERSEDVLLHGIYQDVHRTRGSMEFFRDMRVQVLLVRVLYVYSMSHTDISYNQGMGELLAVLAYLLHVEQFVPASAATSPTSSEKSFRISPRDDGECDEESSYVYVESFVNVSDESDATKYLARADLLGLKPFAGLGDDKYHGFCRDVVEEILREIADPRYLEHDCYLLLESMMERMAGAYCPLAAECMSWLNCEPIVTEDKDDNASSAYCSGAESLVIAQREIEASSPLCDQVRRIQDHILTRYDPPTARHLVSLGVEPEMLLLRWVRVLMAREFEMVQVWQLWDAIFTLTSSDFSFINVLCAAAIKEFREDILACEEATSVFLCVRDLNARIDAKRLVENARELFEALGVAATLEQEINFLSGM